MAPNPVDATRRLRMQVKIDSQTQFVMLRVRATMVDGWQETVSGEFRDWLTNKLLSGTDLEGASDKSQVDIISVDYADIGSEVFLPTAATAVGEVQTGDDTETPLTAATLVSFSGRSVGGISRFFLRGLHCTTYSSAYADFRLSTAENAAVLAAIEDLDPDTGGLGSMLCATDNEPVLYWKPYMNVSVSRRYVNHARSL